MSDKIAHVTAATFDAEVLKSKILTLVDFWASWCGPCRMIAPILDQLAEQYAGRVKLCKVNVDEESDLAERYRVMSIPTIVLFRGGEVLQTSIGVKSKKVFADWIDSNLE